MMLRRAAEGRSMAYQLAYLLAAAATLAAFIVAILTVRGTLAGWALAGLGCLNLLALLLIWWQSRSMQSRQRRIQQQGQTDRDRLEREVAQRTAQLTELAQYLQTAREDERGRLARDLHDELGALLTSAKLDAARIRSRLAASAPEARERLSHLVEMLDQVIAHKRRITENLRPSALSHLGLVATLEIQASEFSAQAGVEVECDLAPVRLTPSAELVVYRLVQEALTNIRKYARAGRVRIDLKSVLGQAHVSVHDDGIGFDPVTQGLGAYGLVGMRYRVEAERGRLNLKSAPGQGTLIEVILPELA